MSYKILFLLCEHIIENNELMSSKNKKSYLGIVLALLIGVGGLFSCEDDEIVTPDGGDDDACTGSYCELDMNKSTNDIVFVSKNNPETF